MAEDTRTGTRPADAAAQAPNRWPWPPLIYGAAILIGIAGHYILPLPDPGHGPELSAALHGFGWALLVTGAAFDLSAMITMRRASANILPHRAATALVTWGPFAISRNPIYLGNTLMMLGAGIAFGNGWLILTGLAAAALVQPLAIRREEAHLAALFGPAWLDYAGRVRRWLGRRR
ncbi:hypothetical protein ASG72_15475 [Bosea sp. Leaf344]|uniref:methyltransferase family protein n=1 Tax=Bosea sp. Leaf344 TaxID=1736346 RepID=UPI0006FC9943|nr:isoprenylcysteine carboxylmethyltransferase family protein [Bosea sp. Leaf344]KQU51180.1 hypothetical protein ASG72_15475 [Bosea sp. Leaf344]